MLSVQWHILRNFGTCRFLPRRQYTSEASLAWQAQLFSMEAVIQVTVKNIVGFCVAVLFGKTVPIVGKNLGTGGILVLQSQPVKQRHVYELLAGAR